MVTNFTIDNRTSEKLSAFLNSKIEKEAELSLLLPAFTLVGFETIEKSLINSNIRLILSTDTIDSSPERKKYIKHLMKLYNIKVNIDNAVFIAQSETNHE